ncbi:MAG: acyl-CoA dehydrogenase family protein [Hydrogenophaga sp.]|uniref:acyl-CoA dehydrogenase family protein n=1 Tax=Hydrogenophaga sp. TaxID=1904254 RepID=UPI0040365D40
MNFDYTAEQTELMDSVKRFVDFRVEPQMVDTERRNAFAQETLDEMAELGLFGISIPEEYGGSGLSHLSRVLIHQMAGRTGFGFSGLLASHTGIGTEGLVALGNDEQKRRYLPRMATGELRAAFALTEPEAGSDAGSVKTTARRDGDRYLLNGVKHFISGGAHAGLITVVARTGAPNAKELSVFLVEPSFPGFRIGPSKFETMGCKGHPVSELIFEDCEVPVENRLGPEGEGWAAAVTILNEGRPLVAGRCVGACERLIELSVDYARERRQFGRAIGDFQAVQIMLADMQTRTEAARWLTYKAAKLSDEGRVTRRDTSMAKLFATETLAMAADHAVQIQGGSGYMNGNPVERFYRDARITRIYEGTSEIQRSIIARSMLEH